MVKKIIKLSAVWCAPCRDFKKTFEKVSKLPEFGDIVFTDYDIEKDEESVDYVSKHQVRQIPATLILDENDDLIYKVMGNIPQNDFVNIINEAKRRQTK